MLRAKWIQQISKHQEFDDTPANYLVCSLHFHQTEFIRRGKRTTLVKGAFPTIFPKYVHCAVFTQTSIMILESKQFLSYSESGVSIVYEEHVQGQKTLELAVETVKELEIVEPATKTTVAPTVDTFEIDDHSIGADVGLVSIDEHKENDAPNSSPSCSQLQRLIDTVSVCK